MATTEEKIESLHREHIRLEMKLESVKEQHAETKRDLKEIKEDFDVRFDDLKKEIISNHRTTSEQLQEINKLITEGRGAKKAITIIITGLTIIGSVVAWVYNFFK